MRIRFLVLILSVLFYSSPVAADVHFIHRPDVKKFIDHMVQQHKFKKTKLIALFNVVKVRPKVIRHIKSPLEQRPWYTYERLFITEWRIRKGVEFWNKYHTILTQVEKKYGVPANIIVATIGIETKYGNNTGEYPVIDALANIAFSDSPRAAFFRRELEEFLLLTREQHLNPLRVMGSYAGAIGQPQFMPSSYRRYAVSFSGHSKIDLSHNEGDVIASIANYYKHFGWQTGQPVAIPASIAGNKYQFFLNKDKDVTMISQPTLAGYGEIPRKLIKHQKYKLIELRGYWGNEYWFGFHNFNVIKRYNPSDLYAMAVFQLSHYISTLREKLNGA